MALIGELLGPDPSVGGLGKTIAERAAGNPFFAEEIVRELAERGVLHGERGGYVSTVGAAEVSVPPLCRRPLPPASTALTQRPSAP